jgi:hypothetical protein
MVRAVGGFDEQVLFSEDWEFFTRIGLSGASLVVDRRIGCYYRQRVGSKSTDRVGKATARAHILTTLHEKLRHCGRDDWFGLDLLKSEQAVYQALVRLRVQDRRCLDPLLRNILELQQRVGFGQYGWRFRLMARILGYARAERLRTFVVRWLGIRPPYSLDMAPWRQNG